MLGVFGLRPVPCEYGILTENGDFASVQLRARERVHGKWNSKREVKTFVHAMKVFPAQPVTRHSGDSRVIAILSTP